MEFARKQLEKYGWTDGKGLGKDENGISEPLKAKIKRSNTGVGYDPASDFTEHWWSALYDKAVSNLEVQNKNGKTKKITQKTQKEFEITNSTWKMKKKKKKSDKKQYSEFFIKTSVIGQGGDRTTRVRESDSETESECEDKVAVKMTDEELYAACQGRTAHKGARHGLRALGKLARIEEQEQILLQHIRYKGYSHHEKIKNNSDTDSKVVEDISLQSDEEIDAIKMKKKKKRCNSTDIQNMNKVKVACDNVGANNVALKEKDVRNGRKFARSKTKIAELTIKDIGCVDDKIVKIKKKKKKSNNIKDELKLSSRMDEENNDAN